MRNFDIYEEIASVCPTQADLRNLPMDESNSRIQSFNSKIMVNEKAEIKDEDLQSMEIYESYMELPQPESVLSHSAYLDYHYDSTRSGVNIFEDFPQEKSWNSLGICELK